MRPSRAGNRKGLWALRGRARARCGRGKCGKTTFPNRPRDEARSRCCSPRRPGGQQIQTAVFLKGFRHADPLPLARRVGGMTAPAQRLSSGCMLAGADQRCALRHQVAIRGPSAIPFEHREFRMVGCAPLAVAEDMGELPDPGHSGDEQLLHRKFRRGVEVAQGGLPRLRVVKLGGERPEMRFEPRTHLQSRRVDLDEAAIGEEAANSCENSSPRIEPRAAQCEAIGSPPFLHRTALVLAGAPTYVRVYNASSAVPRSRQ
jgi:hypothetical protein